MKRQWCLLVVLFVLLALIASPVILAQGPDDKIVLGEIVPLPPEDAPREVVPATHGDDGVPDRGDAPGEFRPPDDTPVEPPPAVIPEPEMKDQTWLPESICRLDLE